jgi:hypothetical protein
MADYRLYLHDHQGHFQSATDLSCLNDAEAKAAARALLKGEGGELWEHGRPVQMFAVGGMPAPRWTSPNMKAGRPVQTPGLVGDARLTPQGATPAPKL